MFKSSKTFKDIESSYWSEESNEKLLNSLQKRLEKVFWKNHFSLSECKEVLKDYLGRTVDEGTKALMHLTFATEAAKVSSTYGGFGASFCHSIDSSARKYMDYAKQHPDFFRIHEAEFKKLVNISDPLGYGVTDGLECMLDNVSKKIQ